MIRLVLTGTTTKKTSNVVTCVERGTRCPACRLPKRPRCPVCGRMKPGRQAVLPAPNYRAWEKTALVEIREQRGCGAKPITVPVHVRAVFYRARRVGDLVGYMQALADVLERGRVVENDRLIVSWDGSRMDVDPARPRVELEVMALAAEQPDLAAAPDPFFADAEPERKIRQRILG